MSAGCRFIRGINDLSFGRRGSSQDVLRSVPFVHLAALYVPGYKSASGDG